MPDGGGGGGGLGGGLAPEAERISPEKGMKALLAAIRLFDPKSKVESLPFTPLIEATHATDFGSAALTSSSSREEIKTACETLATKLSSLKKLGDLQKQAVKLMSMLEFPPRPLLDAFAKELRAGEGGAAGGEAAQAAEALLATRRVEVARVVIVPTEATGVDACVKMKPLFRHIRTVYPNVSATELEP